MTGSVLFYPPPRFPIQPRSVCPSSAPAPVHVSSSDTFPDPLFLPWLNAALRGTRGGGEGVYMRRPLRRPLPVSFERTQESGVEWQSWEQHLFCLSSYAPVGPFRVWHEYPPAGGRPGRQAGSPGGTWGEFGPPEIPRCFPTPPPTHNECPLPLVRSFGRSYRCKLANYLCVCLAVCRRKRCVRQRCEGP